MRSPRDVLRAAVRRNVILVAAALALATPSAAFAADTLALSGRTMGTTWSAKWIQENEAVDPVATHRDLADLLERLEGVFSTYRPESEVSRFNRMESTDWFPVSPELAAAAREPGPRDDCRLEAMRSCGARGSECGGVSWAAASEGASAGW